MFRRLESRDIDKLHFLLNYCQKDEEYFHPHSFDKRNLKKLVYQKHNDYFVLEEDNKIIGYSMLRTFGSFKKPTYGGIIDKDYRGKGYGESLLRNTLEKAKELGFKNVLLKVHDKNSKAIKLYNKVGFREIKKVEKQYWMEIDL